MIKKNINNFLNYFATRTLIKIIFVHFVILVLIFMGLKFIFHFEDKFYLLDDGYYNYSKLLYEKQIELKDIILGPGVPTTLQVIHFFPEPLHPYLRLLISFILDILIVITGYNIFKNILGRQELVLGIFIATLNPLYLWWGILRLAPELYVTLFLGLIILLIMKYNESGKIALLTAAALTLLVSVFYKPVLFFVPLFASIFLFKKNKYFSLALFVMFLFGTSATLFYIKYTEAPSSDSVMFRGTENILFVHQLEACFMTGRLGAERKEPKPVGSNGYISGNLTREWMDKYKKEHDRISTIKMNYDFIKENPGMFIFSKVISPVSFISFADNTVNTLVNLIINGIIVIISIIGLRAVPKSSKREGYLILFCLLGYYFTYFLNAPHARYAIPFMVYFSFFSGRYLYGKLSSPLINPAQN